MILLIDNYDSFVYNLYQLIGFYNSDIKVIRNDEYSIEEIEKLQPEKIIISPGPGKPSEAGEIERIIKHFYDKIPILGICLGHQAICESFGAKIEYAKKVMHGKTSKITIDNQVAIFKGIDQQCEVARYHSLAVNQSSLPKELVVIGYSEDNEVMAVKHRDYPVYGLQFHPESILSKDGKIMIKNFMGENV